MSSIVANINTTNSTSGRHVSVAGGSCSVSKYTTKAIWHQDVTVIALHSRGFSCIASGWMIAGRMPQQ